MVLMPTGIVSRSSLLPRLSIENQADLSSHQIIARLLRAFWPHWVTAHCGLSISSPLDPVDVETRLIDCLSSLSLRRAGPRRSLPPLRCHRFRSWSPRSSLLLLLSSLFSSHQAHPFDFVLSSNQATNLTTGITSDHFWSSHRGLGLALFILVIFQIAFGTAVRSFFLSLTLPS